MKRFVQQFQEADRYLHQRRKQSGNHFVVVNSSDYNPFWTLQEPTLGLHGGVREGEVKVLPRLCRPDTLPPIYGEEG
jgi:hypothetical protein